MLINTYLTAAIFYPSIWGGDGITGVRTLSNSTLLSGNLRHLYGHSWSETDAPFGRKYYVSVPWISVYLVAVVVLTAVTVCNLWLRITVRVPDFLDSVSGLARDSVFVARPEGVSSALGGAEQMKLLNEKWVRIQDVHPLDPVGRIALSDDRTLGMQKLEGDRLYG
ncbi:hypothetical protein OQA88_13454 [Cercophora sp. LCS_1]